MTKAETVASYIREHPEFIVPRMDDPYGHMGATLTDAVLQSGIDYNSVVRRRVDRIQSDYPNASTTSEFARVLRDNGVDNVLRFKGRKPRTLLALINLLVENEVESEHDLLVWLRDPDNVARVKRIKGIKDKTANYLRILAGDHDAIAVDVRLLAFLAEAGVPTSDFTEAESIIRDAAKLLGVEPARLDKSIWNYMEPRLAARRKGDVCHRTVNEHVVDAAAIT
jgi:thermostable 8-oxoguanine DNA glycosylase